MWLNDYAPCEDIMHDDTEHDNLLCEEVEECVIDLRSSISSANNQDSTNDLLFTLLEVVEQLSKIVLGGQYDQTTTISPPTSPKMLPPPPELVSTPTTKENKWVTVTGKSKRRNNIPYKQVESTNIFNLLPSSPAESVNDDEIPAHTWADSPIPSSHAQNQLRKPQRSSKSNQRRPAAVVSKFPERNTTWKSTVPGNSSFSDMVRHGRKVVLFSDSICNRFNERELNRKATNSHIKKKAFPGATAEDLAEHHMHPYLRNNLPDTAIIHAGANDIFKLGGKEGGLSEDQINIVCSNILTCGTVCKEYGISKVIISSVLPGRSKTFNLSAIYINNKLETFCEELGFDFIRNTNIIYEKPTKENEGLYYSDGLHLNDEGRQILMDNFIDYLNNHY